MIDEQLPLLDHCHLKGMIVHVLVIIPSICGADSRGKA